MATTHVLITGVFKWLGKDHCQARCTTTLVQSEGVNIVVDPGNLAEAQNVVKALKRRGLTPRDIHFVVDTHYHPDHVGANFLFQKACVVDGESLNQGDEFVFYNTKQPLALAPNVTVLATPGHTADCCSVMVETKRGTVAVVGDLFWRDQAGKLGWAEYPKKLKVSQRQVLRLAQYVVPGHAKEFKVKH
jgi:glyoxylase-like metal-dependent hydrolase (beta-lactamase superfamily II)